MLLAIDTSTDWIGLALFDGTRVLCEQTWRSQYYHTTELVPAISELFARTRARKSDLTGLGVALGPGSFTGLRIGMGVCKGMALALRLPDGRVCGALTPVLICSAMNSSTDGR